jgi:hypothetical protein
MSGVKSDFSPIPSAGVSAVSIGNGHTSRLADTVADRSGRFSMKLPPGSYNVSLALKGGTASVYKTVVIRAGRVTRVKLVEGTV